MDVTSVSTTVFTSDDLWTAVNAAQAGDTILMAPGNYSMVALANMNPSGMVTISSLDPTHPAVINSIGLSNDSNLTFSHVEVTPKSASGYAVSIGSSTNIVLDTVNLHGTAGSTTNGSAVLIQNSNQVTVQNSEIHSVGTGITYLNSDHVMLANNNLHDINVDAMHGGGTSDITITHNTFTNFAPAGGDHPDAIQFWTTGTTTAAHDIVISDNTMTRGTGSTFQGVFMGADPTLAFQNVTISGNAIVGGMYNGVALQYANNVKVEDNLVQGYKDMTSWIYLSKVTNGSLDNNTTTSINNPNNSTNLSIHDNTTIAQGLLGDLSVLEQWQAQAQTPTYVPPAIDPGSIMTSIMTMWDLGGLSIV